VGKSANSNWFELARHDKEASELGRKPHMYRDSDLQKLKKTILFKFAVLFPFLNVFNVPCVRFSYELCCRRSTVNGFVWNA